MNRREFVMGLAAAMVPLSIQAGRASGKWLPTPPIPAIRLQDQNSVSRTSQSLLLRGPVVVGFMFTGCSTVCPPQTALLRSAWQSWRTDATLASVNVALISITPAIDRPAQLREYARVHHLPASGWSLLTGEEADVGKLLAAFDVDISRPADHSPLFWLGDPRRNRWTRSSSLVPANTLTRSLRDVLT